MPSIQSSESEEEVAVGWLRRFAARRTAVFLAVTLGAVAFSCALIVLGVFYNKAFLPWGIAGAGWKLAILLLGFGGWLFAWIRKFFGRRVANGGGSSPADSK